MDPELARRARADAERFVELAREVDGVELDYGAHSLGWLTEHIDAHRQSWPTMLEPHVFENLKGVMGCFVGECLVERLGGGWVWFNNAPAVQIEGLNGEVHFAFPLEKVLKQLANGSETDSVLAFFVNMAVLSGRITPVEVEGADGEEENDDADEDDGTDGAWTEGAIVDPWKSREGCVRAVRQELAELGWEERSEHERGLDIVRVHAIGSTFWVSAEALLAARLAYEHEAPRIFGIDVEYTESGNRVVAAQAHELVSRVHGS
jgi:hypothetical protein